MRYVIIGASAAGTQAAEELRRLDKEAKITVITAENYSPYSRCLISRFVDGRLAEDSLYFKTKHFFKDHSIEGVLNTRVVGIDRGAKKVVCGKDKVVPYDKLLIATGSSPLFPRIDGTDLEGVFSFHSLNDAHSVLNRIKQTDRAVVLGAGFVGLEAAYALSKRGLKVTVVEKASQILPNQLDVTGSQIIQRDLEELGVEIILNESLMLINGTKGGPQGVRSVTLADKSQIPCGIVIIATGMKPNKDVIEESGVKTGRGVVVDEFLRTSDPDIYAAGDVIEVDDVATGKRVTSATWFNAVLQGKFAAYNMAGLQRRYSQTVGIQNAVQFHQIPAISFGKTQVDAEEEQDYEVLSIHKDKVYKKLVLKEDRICGMIFVGDIVRSGFYAALIRSGVDVSGYEDKLLDSDFSYAHFRDLDFDQYRPYIDPKSG